MSSEREEAGPLRLVPFTGAGNSRRQVVNGFRLMLVFLMGRTAGRGLSRRCIAPHGRLGEHRSGSRLCPVPPKHQPAALSAPPRCLACFPPSPPEVPLRLACLVV